MKELRDKVAIVTGGGSGIGKGIAVALADAGVQIMITGRRAGSLEMVAAAINKGGGMAFPVTADVSSAEDVTRVVDSCLREFGKVDILVNNAGISGGGQIHEHSIDTWDKVMAINLRGPFLMARTVLESMRNQNSGHIINISSVAGLEIYPGMGAYGVSKHALNALGEFIQRENQGHNIRVDTVCPGWVVSEMTEDIEELAPELCLQPEDIADLTMWLLTRGDNVKIGRPVLIQTMQNPWQG